MIYDAVARPRNFFTMKLREWIDKFRKFTWTRGYTCDHCGRELFDYPNHRFCEECEGQFLRPIRTCPKCGRATAAEGVCLTCKSKMPKFTRGVSAFAYKGELALAVNRMKNGTPRLSAYFGERIAEVFLETFEGVNERAWLIVPVPLTEKRRRERGYNQAELLSESVQSRLTEKGVCAAVDTELLVKTRETALQKEKGAKERADNAEGAYRVHKRKMCEGKSILLVDDILTTGATGSACARVLLGAHAKEVVFLTVAAMPERK